VRAPLGMDSDSRAERDAKIYARRIEGVTCKAIAREFGLSKVRVWEIAKHMARKAKWREQQLSWPLQRPDHDDKRGNR
jgi:Mor family transcriptional regulator